MLVKRGDPACCRVIPLLLFLAHPINQGGEWNTELGFVVKVNIQCSSNIVFNSLVIRIKCPLNIVLNGQVL